MEPKLTLRLDGQVVEGTAVEIVEQMRSLAFGADHMTIAEFVRNTAENMFDDPEVIAGETDHGLCVSLVNKMLSTGLAVEFDPDDNEDKTTTRTTAAATDGETAEDKED